MDRRPELWGGECNVSPVLANLDEEEWGFVSTYYWIMFLGRQAAKISWRISIGKWGTGDKRDRCSSISRVNLARRALRSSFSWSTSAMRAAFSEIYPLIWMASSDVGR
jgi:hypothetical protein